MHLAAGAHGLLARLNASLTASASPSDAPPYLYAIFFTIPHHLYYACWLLTILYTRVSIL